MKSIVVMLFAVVLMAGEGRAETQSSDIEAVLKAREAALLARDVEATLRLFSDDALVVTSSGRIIVGRDQIRRWVQVQVDRSEREEPGPRYRQGAKLTWPGKVFRDDWQKMGVSPTDVTQDAIVQNGRIRFFSTTFTAESVARFEAAPRKK